MLFEASLRLWLFAILLVLFACRVCAQNTPLNPETELECITDSFTSKAAYTSQLEAALRASNFGNAGKLYLELASLAIRERNYSQATLYYKKALNAYDQIHDQINQTETLCQMADCYNLNADLDLAFQSIFKALMLSEELKDPRVSARVNINFAYFLHKQSDYKEALKYASQAIGYSKQLQNDSLLAESYFLYGLSLSRENQIKAAIKYFNKSQQLYFKTGQTEGSGLVYNAMADLLSKEKKWILAFEYYQKSIDILSFDQNYTQLYKAYIDFAALLLAIKKSPERNKYFIPEFDGEYAMLNTYLNLGVFWAKQGGNLEYQMYGYQRLSQFYFSNRNLEFGISANASFDSVREVLFSKQRLRIEEIKRQNETEIKDKQIASLEEDIGIRKLNKQRNELIIMLLIFGVVFLILLAIGGYYRSKERKKVTKMLLRKNIEIETQRNKLEVQNQELIRKNVLIEEQKNAIQAALDALHTTQSKLVHSERLSSIHQLTSGLIHEINNPVNAISGGVQSLMPLMGELRNLLE
ncbi:MAG: hypothetical protein RIS47_2068, partial [Bacteroidota bacterium]